MVRGLPLPAILLALSAAPAVARDLCPDRPGLGTPACTLDPGRVQIEIGVADWALDRESGRRTDTITAGDMLMRVGLDSQTEIQIGWTAYRHVRSRDRVAGTRDRGSGIGDASLAIRRNLTHPDGSGLAIALQPYISLPTGGSAIGAGDWGGGLIAPISYDLPGGVQLGITPQIAAAVDADGDGRHILFGSVVGLGFDLSDAIGATVELTAYRDRDPASHTTQALAGLSIGWQPGDDTQFDAGANIGLNRDTPDVELYFGITRRF